MVVDALSCRKYLPTTMTINIPGFEQIKQEYADDKEFGAINSDIKGDQDKHTHYNIHDGFLFKSTKLHLPDTSIRDHVV